VKFKPKSQQDFHNFFSQSAGWISPRKSDDLHGERAPAACEAPLPPCVPQGAGKGEGVDPGVPAETPVLEFRYRGFEFKRNRGGGGKAPLTIGGQPGAQEFAVWG
jgi:hypothetical protein